MILIVFSMVFYCVPEQTSPLMFKDEVVFVVNSVSDSNLIWLTNVKVKVDDYISSKEQFLHLASLQTPEELQNKLILSHMVSMSIFFFTKIKPQKFFCFNMIIEFSHKMEECVVWTYSRPGSRIRNSELFEGIIYDIGIGNTFVGNYGYWSGGKPFNKN